MILSTIWYVIGAIPTNQREAKKTQSVVYNFLNGCDEIEWDSPTKRGNMSRSWFHIPKKLGGWGLAPVTRSLKTRKLALLKSFLLDHEKGITKPWHAFVTNMLCEHMSGWGQRWNDILLWDGDQPQGDSSAGQWSALSPWWRETWQLWLNLRCRPDKHSFSRRQLMDWPVWNNRLLSANHGINNALHRAFSNSSTRSQMHEIRKMGFTKFRDFMHSNGVIMDGHSLYTTVTVSLSVNASDVIVTQNACASLSRILTALWANTTKNWLRLTSESDHHNNTHTKWYPQSAPKQSFTSMNNASLTKLVTEAESNSPHPKLISLNNRPITINWTRERSLLKQLAPSRRDLLLRLSRNALPLGIKRIHWQTQCQTTCMLCANDTVETAHHLFWDCPFAKLVWGRLHRPWRNHTGAELEWREALLGHEARLHTFDNPLTEQLWSITRACVIRTIWLERNRRYFYPELRHKSALFRHHQACDDIKAHTEAWARRISGEDREKLLDLISHLTNSNNEYRMLSINLANPQTPSTSPYLTPPPMP